MESGIARRFLIARGRFEKAAAGPGLAAVSVLVTLVNMLCVVPLTAQTAEPAADRRLLGAALGGVAVGSVAYLGGLPACNRTRDPAPCARWVAIGSTVIGIGAGFQIGSDDPAEIDDRFGDAVLGANIGAGVGFALKTLVRHYGWSDMLAVSAIGFGIGASGDGAGIGLAVGAVTGAALWGLHPQVGPAGAVAFTLAGLGLGAVVDWVSAAASKSGPGGAPITLAWSFHPG